MREPHTIEFVHDASTSNLVIMLQKLAKNASYYRPLIRSAILAEAAERLTEYRQAERAQEPPVCPTVSPDGWLCTREALHAPPHVAHNADNEVVASWQ